MRGHMASHYDAERALNPPGTIPPGKQQQQRRRRCAGVTVTAPSYPESDHSIGIGPIFFGPFAPLYADAFSIAIDADDESDVDDD